VRAWHFFHLAAIWHYRRIDEIDAGRKCDSGIALVVGRIEQRPREQRASLTQARYSAHWAASIFWLCGLMVEST